jgi:hypothetical protein
MKSFLLNNTTKQPIIRWGQLPDNVFFEGIIPDGFSLAVAPSQPYIIIDVDRHGNKDGFKHLSTHILDELNLTFNYPTKNNGIHYWLYYTGNKIIPNKASGIGIDVRVGRKTFDDGTWRSGGYVKWHPRDSMDIRNEIYRINKTSDIMNKWIEDLFCTYKTK